MAQGWTGRGCGPERGGQRGKIDAGLREQIELTEKWLMDDLAFVEETALGKDLTMRQKAQNRAAKTRKTLDGLYAQSGEGRLV
jgi:hypothetical protein